MPDREKLIKDIKQQMSEPTNEFVVLWFSEAEYVLELLKEQGIGHWILLENCSNPGVYCSECHVKVFDNYPFKKKFSYFCPHCGTRMEGETERQ